MQKLSTFSNKLLLIFIILCNFATYFPIYCLQEMKTCTTYGLREYVRMGVFILLCVGGIVSDCAARNYIRFNADFSYARDLSRSGVGPSFIEEMTPEIAMEWIGSGMTESLRGSNGFAPAVGAGYRYMHNLFLLDLGLGVEYRYCINRPYDISDARKEGIDTQQYPYIGYHYWTSRAIHYQHMGVTVPVMMGAEIKKIYFMAGVKAGIDIWGSSKEKGAYSMQAEYERYMDVLVNIPGHGIVEKEPYTMESVNNAAVQWNVRACAEIGYCIGGATERKYNSRKMEPRYYVGAFAEYGFVGAQGAYLPLLAGVRLTALLSLPEPQECKCYRW